MKDSTIKALATIATAAIIGTASVLWSMNERLTRIETKLETFTAGARAGLSHHEPAN